MKKTGLFLIVALLFPIQIYAYELTFTCGDLGQPCREGETAKQVFWWKSCVSYYVNELGSSDFDGLSDELLDVVNGSFQQWNDAEPGFRTNFAGLTNIRTSEEFDGNVITWRDKNWPHASSQALALTIISFDPDTGEILDADIEFNSVVHEFSLDEDVSIETADFRSTMVHEAGHFVGLDHSQEKEATMFGRSSPGQSKKRTLHPDDLAGFSEIYPDTEEGVCPDLPDYLEGPEEGGCCSTLASEKGGSGFFFLLVLAVLFIRDPQN